MAITNLVLVTGAGASTKLGSGDSDLPLMDGWARTLKAALDREEPGLAELVGFADKPSGPEFERAVGDFLAWYRILPLSSRYLQWA